MRLRLFARLQCPATDVGVAADAATKGATDAAVAGAGADVAASGAAADLAGAGALAGTGAALDAGAGAAGAGAGAAALPAGMDVVDIGASALPAAGGAGAGALPAIGAGVAGAGLGASMAGNPTEGTTASQAAEAKSFLPATSNSDLTSLSPDVAQSFGVADSSLAPQPSGGFETLAPNTTTDLGSGYTYNLPTDSTDALGGGSGGGTDWSQWLKNPKNAAQLGLLGVSGLNALTTPKLPGAAQTALNAAGPGVTSAQSIIQSGGTATPIWTQQKASIDASIDQQIQEQTEAMMQNAANSDQGNQNSGIVQQQIAKMTADLNTQREQLYLQAQQQNINNAVGELTGSNQTLTSIAQMELAQQEEARNTASETARLALQLEALSG